MSPTVAELLAALPQDETREAAPLADDRLKEVFEQLALRPVPVGSLRRLWTLGGLHARLALAYLFYYIRTCFHSTDQKQRRLSETNLRGAMQTLEAMGYLRGAVMKAGQALAMLPHLLPDEFSRLLGSLYFEAPPMHFSLLRESLTSELGRDPEEVFAAFEPDAFAAASLGQVHRARLPTGEQVVVKVQYPGIGRTIAADVANLRRLLFPLRLSADWDSLNAQFGEIQSVLESETDYEQEAASLREVRAVFREQEGIDVPRVFEQYSTRRVLTMERIDGDHLEAFLAGNPSQELRNRFGEKILRASLRVYCSRRLIYSDFSPGNVLFQEDGRLGWIDFGGLRRLDDADWALLREAHLTIRAMDRSRTLAYVQRSLMYSDEEMTSRASVVDLVEEWANFYWAPLRAEGPFDYGDPEYIRRGVALWGRAAEARVLRQQPLNVVLHRCHFELYALLYRLGARIESRRIYDEEIKATGWTE